MKVLILHGSFGSPSENWFPWLKLKLEELGHRVLTPQMPVDDYATFDVNKSGGQQTFSNWLEKAESLNLSVADGQELVVVAHSIAPAFVLGWLDYNPQLNFKKFIAVAPFISDGRKGPEYDQKIQKVNETFLIVASRAVTGEDMIKRAKEITATYAKDDPYVSSEMSEEFIEKTGAKRIVLETGGHLNSEAGVNEFQFVLDEIVG